MAETEQKQDTLKDILNKLQMIDEDLDPDQFNPEEVVGDLRDKVDAIKWRIDSWEAQAANIERWIEQLVSKQSSITRKVAKLENYVHREMMQKGYERLPGHMMDAAIQKNPPSVQIDLEATAESYLKHPALMQERTVFGWNKKAVKEALDSGQQLSFARITQSTRVVFKPKKG